MESPGHEPPPPPDLTGPPVPPEILPPELSEPPPPPRRSADDWLIVNLAPLLVLGIALTATFVCSMLLALQPRHPMAHRPPAEVAPLPPPLDGKLDPRKVPWVAAFFVLNGPGFFICFFGIYFCMVSPEFRRKAAEFLRPLPRRPRPALNAVDVIAAFAVYQAVAVVQLTVFATVFDLHDTSRYAQPITLLANDMALAAGVVTGVFLARYRGKSPRGSQGFWPFWKGPSDFFPDEKPRSILSDMLLGAMAYPLFNWTVLVANLLNEKLLEWRSAPIDRHKILEQLTNQSAGSLAIVFLTATIGAAVFEEIIFRGMMYNVLRRYLSLPGAAMIGAAVFSAMHRIESNFFALMMLALVLTWLYERTGRLVAGMTFHALNNLISLIFALGLGIGG